MIKIYAFYLDLDRYFSCSELHVVTLLKFGIVRYLSDVAHMSLFMDQSFEVHSEVNYDKYLNGTH